MFSAVFFFSVIDFFGGPGFDLSAVGHYATAASLVSPCSMYWGTPENTVGRVRARPDTPDGVFRCAPLDQLQSPSPHVRSDVAHPRLSWRVHACDSGAEGGAGDACHPSSI